MFGTSRSLHPFNRRRNSWMAGLHKLELEIIKGTDTLVNVTFSSHFQGFNLLKVTS